MGANHVGMLRLRNHCGGIGGRRQGLAKVSFCVEIWLAESSLDEGLRRSVDDKAWDEESDEVWRGMDRSSRYGRALWP